MNINNPITRNTSLLKTKQDKDFPINPNSHRQINSSRKSNIKERELNKSQIKGKEKEKSPLMKNTTKTHFDPSNNVNKKENLYAHTEMKKNLTQRVFAQTDRNGLNSKEIQNFKNNQTSDILNDNGNNKENKEFKIKVKKVFDLNEFTVHNITNDNTTSSNKNQENKAFDKLDPERFEYYKPDPQNQVEGFKVKKSECEVNQGKVEKGLEDRKSRILKEFPIFNNNIFIKENLNFTNNHLDIETLPNMKYSEINSLNESYNDNASNSSLINRSIKNHFIKIDKLNQVSDKIQCERNIKRNNDINLSLDDEKINAKYNNHCSNENKEKYGDTIKETFTLFLQNNSKKEILNEEKSYRTKEEKEKTKYNLKNKTTDSLNSNIKTAPNRKTYTEKKDKTDSSRKTQDIERLHIIQKLSNKFYSPQKNRSDCSKTKNYLSPFSNSIANFNHNYINNSISELNKKVANCDSMLTYFQISKKLKSEVEILTEKVKTLKKIQQTKNHEIEMLKSKYSEAIENYKSEIDNNKRLKEKIDKQNSLVKNLKKNFKILANNLIEITELLLLSKSSAEKRASLIAAENASLSIDIYDSYNNEDEKKSLLQEQIQSLLLEKFYYYKKQLNLDLEAEIEKIKNWNSNVNFLSWKNTNSNNNLNNFNFNNSNNIEMSISNIKITALNKNNENESFESSSKKNISQDYFDMSISNQFLNLNQIPSGNFGNLGSNINININQSPQFIFTNNNYNSKQNPHNDSFGVIDVEGENILGSNSNKNYNSNANNINNYNSNTNNNGNKNLVNYSSNRERNSKCNLYNFGSKDNSNINNNNNNCNINKNKWTLIFNKEEQTDINNYNWNKLNYNSNNREERFRIDSINNQIGANGINKNVALSSNYNSNSYNIFDSFLQSAKGQSNF